MLAGEIDVYVDYLPTAVPQYLNLQPPKTAAATYRAVRDGARQRWCVEWLSAFGFNNTYAVIVRRAWLLSSAPRMVSLELVELP